MPYDWTAQFLIAPLSVLYISPVMHAAVGYMKPKRRRRKCRCCKQFFRPDHRSRNRQRFCSDPACKKASKALSQQLWLAKPENRKHWRGQVERVREWRKAHPRYWERAADQNQLVLQEDCAT
jgi:hypothetical protein